MTQLVYTSGEAGKLPIALNKGGHPEQGEGSASLL